MRLSIVIPAYNEEKRIGSTLKKIEAYCKANSLDYELIVVDDGSKDQTISLVESSIFDKSRFILLKNVQNRGKGFSVNRGMLAAKGDVALFTDADLSTPIEELDNFLLLLPQYDILIASRALKASCVEKQPFYREIMGRTFNLFVQLLVVWGVKDTQCGFKLFKKSAVDAIFPQQKIFGWSFDVELLYLANRGGFKVKEIPVHWVNSLESKVDPFKDAFKMFKEVLMVRYLHLWGR